MIIASLIAKDQDEIDERYEKIKDIKWIQLDVMDGIFVKNHSLDFDFVLPPHLYEAHLMTADPNGWIEKHHENIQRIIFHIESGGRETINLIKSHGKKVGIALNPQTNINKVMPFIDEIDLILVMMVNPGRYGAPFIPQMLEKIRRLREMKPELNIEVDGSINEETIIKAKAAGANMFAVGSYLQKADDVVFAKNVLENLIGIK